MKKIIILWMLLVSTYSSFAQKAEVQQLLLNIEKLSQFKQILTDMKKGYQVISNGYQGIKDLSEGNFNLHQTFLDGLMEVSPAVKKYHKVGLIAQYQVQLVKNYQANLKSLTSQDDFSIQEVNYFLQTQKRLLDQAGRNLEDLITVMTSGALRMNDEERLLEIDRIHAEMQDKLQFLKAFKQQKETLRILRLKEKRDVASMSTNYGLK